MSRRCFRGFVIGLLSGASGIAAPFAAAAPDAPEGPPPAFVAPPPGYEPPTQYAQGTPPAPSVPEAAPTFLTLDRMDPTTRIGIQVGWDKIDDTSLSDAFLMRYELYGQYRLPGRPGGFYAQMPISHAFIFSNGGEDATGYGNIELGGFFIPMNDARLILRAGLAAATGSDSGNGVFANALTVYERMTDLVQAVGNMTTLRLSASTIQRMDTFFLRADAGFDFAIDKPATATTSLFFRANVGAGVRASGVDATLELANFALVNGTVNGGIEGRFNHTAGISLRTQGEDQFHIGTVFPLDDGVRGEVWIISVGYQRALTM